MYEIIADTLIGDAQPFVRPFGLGVVSRQEGYVAPADGIPIDASDVVVARHHNARGERGPLQYQGVQLYPSFGEPFSLAAGKPLAFLFTLRPADRRLGEATVELLRGTEAVRRAGVPLPAPDPDGQVRVVSGLPIDGLAPGAYVLRLALSDGRGFETRTAEVTLAP